jgi:hypothetical protein
LAGWIRNPEWYIDWSIDWQHRDQLVDIRLTLLEQAVGQRHSVLTEVMMALNETFSARYYEYAEAGFEDEARQIVLESLIGIDGFDDIDMLLEDSLPRTKTIGYVERRSDKYMEVVITSRRLGEDTGRDVVIHVGRQITMIVTANRRRLKKPTEEEAERLREIYRRR